MEIITTIGNWLWTPLAYIALLVGAFFTVLSRGVQVRRFPDFLRQLKGGKAEDGKLSSFQALALTLSGRLGVGSLAGVATALATGGPGALIWMMVTGLLVSACAYAESVLAQVYKRRNRGEDHGGMPYYIRYGLKLPKLGTAAALLTMLCYGFLFPGIQTNNIASSLNLAFGVPPWLTGVVVTGALALVILGGTKRIANVVQFIIPFLTIGYLLTAAVVLVANLGQIPAALKLIVLSGVGVDHMFGGMVGFAVAWGVRRAVFASATGLGEGTFAAAAANTTHPGKQGIIQAFSIYFDIFLVCMATGLMIVISGAYNVSDPQGGYIVQNVPGEVAGPNFVQSAIDATLPGWGAAFIGIAILLFAFNTQVHFFYVATTNLLILLRDKRHVVLESLLKAGALVISFTGAVVQADLMWAAGDVGYALLGWLNMTCLVLLTPVIAKVVKDYERQRKEGVNPVFDPRDLGITGASYWTDPETSSNPIIARGTEEQTAHP